MGKKIVQVTSALIALNIVLEILGFVLMFFFDRFSWANFTWATVQVRAGLFGFAVTGEIPTAKGQEYFNQLIRGGYSYADMYGAACGVGDMVANTCQPMTGTYYGTWCFFMFMIVSFCLEFLGSSLFSSYWNKGVERGYRFKTVNKNNAVKFLVVSAGMISLSFVVMVYFCYSLMASVARSITAQSATFGFACFYFAVVVLLKFLPIFLINSMKDSYEEYDGEDDGEAEEEDDSLKGMFAFNQQPPPMMNQGMNMPMMPPPHGGRKSVFGHFMSGFNPAQGPVVSNGY